MRNAGDEGKTALNGVGAPSSVFRQLKTKIMTTTMTKRERRGRLMAAGVATAAQWVTLVVAAALNVLMFPVGVVMAMLEGAEEKSMAAYDRLELGKEELLNPQE